VEKGGGTSTLCSYTTIGYRTVEADTPSRELIGDRSYLHIMEEERGKMLTVTKLVKATTRSGGRVYCIGESNSYKKSGSTCPRKDEFTQGYAIMSTKGVRGGWWKREGTANTLRGVLKGWRRKTRKGKGDQERESN